MKNVIDLSGSRFIGYVSATTVAFEYPARKGNKMSAGFIVKNEPFEVTFEISELTEGQKEDNLTWPNSFLDPEGFSKYCRESPCD